MITFITLIIENFKSIRGAYSVPLEKQGLVFIVGENKVSQMADSNGAGKTTILDAICMALYKKMLRGGAAVNYDEDFSCVQLIFKVDEKEYVAIWEQKKKKTSWILAEIVDGVTEEIGKGEEIEQLIGISFTVFVSVVLFGTTSDRFAEQSDAPRKKMFDDLLDLAFFAQKRRVVEDELTMLEGRYTDYEKEQIKLTERKATLIEERDRYGEDSLSIEIDAFKEWASDDDLRLSLYESLNKLTPLMMNARRTIQEEQDLVDESTRLAAIRNRLDQRIGDIDHRVAQLYRDAADVNASEVCKMCRRPITSKREITSYFESEIDPLLAQHRQYRRYQTGIQTVLNAWPKLDPGRDYDNLKLKFEDTMKRIKDVEAGMSQMQEARFMRQAVDELNERIDATNRELATLSLSMDALKSEIHLREFWIEGFGHRGLKAMLIRDYESFLNERLDFYTALLTASEIKLSFSAQRQLKGGDLRDEIGLRIEHNGKVVNYNDLSDGERQRVDVCMVLALQDLVRTLHRGRISLALYDEIFDHLDETGCEQVMEYLTQQRREFGSVFVISHNPKLLSYQADKVITVVKTEKGSAIL